MVGRQVEVASHVSDKYLTEGNRTFEVLWNFLLAMNEVCGMVHVLQVKSR